MKVLKGGLATGAAILIGVLLSPLAKAQTPEATAAVSKLKKRLVADYGFWSKSQKPPYAAAQIPYGKLTHINHAGVNLDSDGTLSVPDGFLEPALLTKAQEAGVKVLLLLGGGGFPALATPGVLDLAVGNLWTFVSEKGYDGVDIDWEFPSTAQDRKTFLALMTALREVFPRPTYTISADIPPWGGGGYDLKGVEPHIDYYNIMMYDCAGPWTDDGQLNSPIFWDTHDPEPWELNMGTPFYGYFYTNVRRLFGPCTNCESTVLTKNYGTYFKQRINHLGWQTFYDPIALVPYMLRTDGKPGFITYDDSVSTYYRTWYSDWAQGLGGTFMWSLDADYDGHTQDLLEAEYAGSLKPTE